MGGIAATWATGGVSTTTSAKALCSKFGNKFAETFLDNASSSTQMSIDGCQTAILEYAQMLNDAADVIRFRGTSWDPEEANNYWGNLKEGIIYGGTMANVLVDLLPQTGLWDQLSDIFIQAAQGAVSAIDPTPAISTEIFNAIMEGVQAGNAAGTFFIYLQEADDRREEWELNYESRWAYPDAFFFEYYQNNPLWVIDTEVPSITITSLVNGSKITLSAQATDNVGVTRIVFNAGGQTIDDITIDPPESPAERSVTWDALGQSGSVTLTVIAYDATGNTKSESVTVTVDNSMNLTVVHPSNVDTGNLFTISGRLTDAQGAGIDGVDVYAKIGASPVDSHSTTSGGGYYSILATAPGVSGSHTVTVEADHNGQRVSASSLLTVTDPKTGHDLAVRDFELSTYSVEPEGTVRLYATFDNQGEYEEQVLVHWYLYAPNSGTPFRHKISDYGMITSQTGSTGQKWIDLQTSSTHGTWNAVVWVELGTDEDPSDNKISLAFNVGTSPDYEEYARFDLAGSVPDTYSDGNNLYNVTVVDVYLDGSAQYQIQGGPTVTLDPDETYFYDSNKLVLAHEWGDEDDDKVMFQMWTYPPPVSFNVQPKQVTLNVGQRATYRVTCTKDLYTWDISDMTSDGAMLDGWSWHKNTVSSGVWDLYCDIPASAAQKTYEFWWELKFEGDKCAQKVELTVLPEHDVSVLNLSPQNGSSYDPETIVPISATVSAANNYTELPNVSLSITGPGEYSYTDSESPSISGSQTVAFSPDWYTTGLNPGDYMITVTATIGNDSNSDNDSQSSTLHINAPPQLSVNTQPDNTNHIQGDYIELRATVTSDSISHITDADVIAHVTWPDTSQTDPVMKYDEVDERYECMVPASQVGTYSGNVTASRPGSTDGDTPFADVVVSNAPPDTTITSSYPAEGEWIRQRSLNFSWIGFDTGTPVSGLQYSWKLDSHAWSAWSNDTNGIIDELSEGSNTLYVKSHDGELEDPEPAQRTFSVDSVAPTVTIVADGGNGAGVDFTTNQPQVLIEGTATDQENLSGLASISLNRSGSNEGTLTNWRFTIDLNEGQNCLTIFATDNTGNTGQDSITITYAPDTPPEVISTSPANNANDVAINTPISVTFSEAMDAVSITTATFLVNDGSSNMGGTVSYSSTTATFTPAAILDYNTTYTATITTGASDLAGNALQADYVWSFTVNYTILGNINGDDKIDLSDAILAIQVITGLHPAGVNLNADVNNNGKIGMAEVLYILQRISGFRDSEAQGFTNDDILGRKFYILEEDFGCRYDAEFISQNMVRIEEGNETADFTYTLTNNMIIVPDPFGEAGDNIFRLQVRHEDYFSVLASFGGGPFMQKDGLWTGISMITDLAFLNNSAEALKNLMVDQGLWGSTVTADGRIIRPGVSVTGSWWIENNIFFFAYPDEDTGCVDYKALKLQDDKLYRQTDAPHTILTRWYFDQANLPSSEFTAIGTYSYNSGNLTLNITSSDFPEHTGPSVSVEQWNVTLLSSTQMTWTDSDNDQIEWSRISGSGDILGEWEFVEPETGSTFRITFNSDNSFLVTGQIIPSTWREATIAVTASLIGGSGEVTLNIFDSGMIEEGNGGTGLNNTGLSVLFTNFSHPLFPAMFPGQVPVNYAWVVEGCSLDSVPLTINASVKSISDTVTTSAGTFTNCIRIEYTYNYAYDPGNGPEFVRKITRYFKENVGILKAIIERSDQVDTAVLSDYSLSGSGIIPMEVGNFWTYSWDRYWFWENGNTETFKITNVAFQTKSSAP